MPITPTPGTCLNCGGGDTPEEVAVISLPSAQRTTSIQRVITATTTTLVAGHRSYTVTVIAAASAASPTLDGVALPVGYTASYSADGANTLEAASLVTVLGDDVIVLMVT